MVITAWGTEKCTTLMMLYLSILLIHPRDWVETSMLHKFDAELLIGQLSYKQKADIYDISLGYDFAKKECSSVIKSPKKAIHR